MSTVHYFLGSRLLDTGVTPERNGGSHSLAYFCQSCGDVWARAVVSTSTGHFDIVNHPCSGHEPQAVPSWGARPGTLCKGHATDLSTMHWAAALEFLPKAVLERELHLLLEHRAKEQA